MDKDSLYFYSNALHQCEYPLVASVDLEGTRLIGRITRAFDGVPSDDMRTWIQCEMLDNHEPSDVIEEGGRLDRFERWQDVPATLFGCFPSAAGFLDDHALLFYMPALMCWDLMYAKAYPLKSPAEVLERIKEDSRPVFERLTVQQRTVFGEYQHYRKKIEYDANPKPML